MCFGWWVCSSLVPEWLKVNKNLLRSLFYFIDLCFLLLTFVLFDLPLFYFIETFVFFYWPLFSYIDLGFLLLTFILFYLPLFYFIDHCFILLTFVLFYWPSFHWYWPSLTYILLYWDLYNNKISLRPWWYILSPQVQRLLRITIIKIYVSSGFFNCNVFVLRLLQQFEK